MNRNDYLDGKVTHEEYYGELARLIGVRFIIDEVAGYSLRQSYKTDKHFNNIPLKYWDMLAFSRPVPKEVKEMDPAFGSRADWVCILKEAARQYVVSFEGK